MLSVIYTKPNSILVNIFSRNVLKCPPSLRLVPCRGGVACVSQRPRELCRHESRFLAGLTLPDRSDDRVQTNVSLPALQFGG